MSYTENVATFLGSLDSFYESVPAEDLELIVGPVLERIRSQTDSSFSHSSTSEYAFLMLTIPQSMIYGHISRTFDYREDHF